jgi:hypothetical protein
LSGRSPAVDEKEAEQQPPPRAAVPMNTTITAPSATRTSTASRSRRRKDQRLSVEVEGARLGRTMFDPYFSIHDPSGQTLAESDDTPLLGHDGFASFIVPRMESI